MGFRLSDEEALTMLTESHESVLTTLRADGRPVSLPVWHVVLGDAVYVTTPRRSKKVARVRNDGRGSLIVSSGVAWAELRAVVAEVNVSVIDDEDVAADVRAAMDEKYEGNAPPLDKLPQAVSAAYDDMVVLRLDLVRPFLTWHNSALLTL